MRFLKDCWYTPGWSADYGREPRSRMIIEQPIMLYRTESGELVALEDRCPHRFAALSMGTLVGDQVQCLYHGLRFDRSGACVHNPHGSIIPKRAHVHSYPVAERDGLVWLWMGDPAKADESKIQRFPMLNQQDRFTYTKGQTMEMPISYELLTDNLMDLSHVAFTHATSLGSDCLVPGVTAVREENGAIWSDRIGHNGSAPACFVVSGACSEDDRVDFWLDIRWSVPANFYLYCGITEPGRERNDGKELSSVQILTPATPTHTYYFVKHFRDYEREDEGMTTAIAEAVVDAFMNEDEPMVLRVQQNMGGRDFWEMRPIMLNCDGAAIKVRKRREELLDREAEALMKASFAVAAE